MRSRMILSAWAESLLTGLTFASKPSAARLCLQRPHYDPSSFLSGISEWIQHSYRSGSRQGAKRGEENHHRASSIRCIAGYRVTRLGLQPLSPMSPLERNLICTVLELRHGYSASDHAS